MDPITVWLTALIGLISNAITGIVTWMQARSHQERMISGLKTDLAVLNEKYERATSELGQTKVEAAEARKLADKYLQVREKLQASTVVQRYAQPVILLGPRGVGKTSLLMQWHAPWDHSNLRATVKHRMVEVPVYDLSGREVEAHFADEEIQVPVERHLVIKVHDFPGELNLQSKVREVAEAETQELRRQTGKNLGVVIVCLFNAEEVLTGISTETAQYYNGDLFKELVSLVTWRKVAIERLILVFNKYDLLLSQVGGKVTDEALLQRCLDHFEKIYKLLSGVCHPDRVCECFTVLGRESLMPKSQGATIVLGEAARHFVEELAGREAAAEVIKLEATRYASARFARD